MKGNEIADKVERALLEGVIREWHEMYPLIGKTVVDVRVSPDKTVLRFVLQDRTQHDFEAVGDCCSSSWWESVNNADDLVSHTISYIVEKDVKWPGCDDEEEKAYGLMFVTDAGHVDLVFRNSSNGFYGGSIAVTTYTEPMKPVRGDWS